MVNAPRKIPFPLEENINQKLDKLVQQDILNKVAEPTDWVSNMVVVKK